MCVCRGNASYQNKGKRLYNLPVSEKSTKNHYFLSFCLKPPYFTAIFARFEHKKDPAKLLLQGQFYNLVCLLCYKAECLFTV